MAWSCGRHPTIIVSTVITRAVYPFSFARLRAESARSADRGLQFSELVSGHEKKPTSKTDTTAGRSAHWLLQHPQGTVMRKNSESSERQLPQLHELLQALHRRALGLVCPLVPGILARRPSYPKSSSIGRNRSYVMVDQQDTDLNIAQSCII